ncbi:MAG: hypothetical protein QG656_12 [Candidatus Hydrogenedentes bacterium]|nr:hypothetical protein [Candidatus Hydrogenedentota bacterium]
MRRIGIVLAVGLVLCTPAPAWGPATHAYLAERIVGPDPVAIYGAAAPDFNGAVLYNEPVRAALKHLTHREFERLAPSPFATGFATHNSLWGADWYAHACYDASAPEIYSTRKIHQLSEECGITVQRAEDVFEGVMDYLLRVERGPELGRLLAEGANASTHEDELVAAFAQAVTERAPQITLDEATAEIRKAAAGYRVLTTMYARELETRDEAYIRQYVPAAIATALKCTMPDAERYVTRAIALCQDDYKPEMDRIVTEVRAKMAESGR